MPDTDATSKVKNIENKTFGLFVSKTLTRDDVQCFMKHVVENKTFGLFVSKTLTRDDVQCFMKHVADLTKFYVNNIYQ